MIGLVAHRMRGKWNHQQLLKIKLY
jgi:hypothetical protein